MRSRSTVKYCVIQPNSNLAVVCHEAAKSDKSVSLTLKNIDASYENAIWCTLMQTTNQKLIAHVF